MAFKFEIGVILTDENGWILISNFERNIDRFFDRFFEFLI